MGDATEKEVSFAPKTGRIIHLRALSEANGNPWTSMAEIRVLGNLSLPVPTTVGLVPTSATAGGSAFTLTVTGTNFISASVVKWNGSNRTTTYVSATQLTASITAADIATAGRPV